MSIEVHISLLLSCLRPVLPPGSEQEKVETDQQLVNLVTYLSPTFSAQNWSETTF